MSPIVDIDKKLSCFNATGPYAWDIGNHTGAKIKTILRGVLKGLLAGFLLPAFEYGRDTFLNQFTNCFLLIDGNVLQSRNKVRLYSKGVGNSVLSIDCFDHVVIISQVRT